MDFLIFVAGSCAAFGCGCALGKFFVGRLNLDEELDQLDSPSSGESSISPKPKLFQTQNRIHRRTRRRYKRIFTEREGYKRLIEAFRMHTNSIRNLDATLTCLNETLKKAEVNHTRSEEKEEIGEADCDIEGEADIHENHSVSPDVHAKHQQVSTLKNTGLKVSFTSHANPLLPDFGGGSLKDRSAGMHIYDAGFEAPKCKDNPWTLDTSGNILDQSGYEDHENVCQGLLESNKPDIPPIRNELHGMFQDCMKDSANGSRASVSTKQLNMLTKPPGGYASVGDLNKIKKEVSSGVIENPWRKKSRARLEGSIQKHTLSRGDELDIINSFSSMKGLGWKEAVNLAREQGYHLHATYINEICNYASEYSKTVLGVKVKDLTFDPRLGSDHRGFGNEAVITAVIDVGGQDTNHRA